MFALPQRSGTNVNIARGTIYCQTNSAGEKRRKSTSYSRSHTGLQTSLNYVRALQGWKLKHCFVSINTTYINSPSLLLFVHHPSSSYLQWVIDFAGLISRWLEPIYPVTHTHTDSLIFFKLALSESLNLFMWIFETHLLAKATLQINLTRTNTTGCLAETSCSWVTLSVSSGPCHGSKVLLSTAGGRLY